MRKSGFPRQSIEQTEPGQLEWVTGSFFILFLGILLCGILQLDVFRASAAYLEDALAASNLASAVIDVEEYGISHSILIRDPEEAYGIYQSALRGNLNLNGEWECPAGGLIGGKVRILDYTIYNVNEGRVEIYHYDGNGQMFHSDGNVGSVYAPNGKMIESTSVYSEVAYPVKGIMGVEAQAHKSNLADIVANE
ncbi:MAG: hypothetical protein NC305_01565 [Lachnospiraceae bacterium]|nr:hypothetical protein [Lachnospiraceae bacterium]MCM1302663.1 hypothetical protein [Butyrivibrio sp.]MCM1409217.1 hypothetical protein [Lachnospiraceae bacterium]